MERFLPLQQYRRGSAIAAALAVICAAYGFVVPLSLIAATLFCASAWLLYYLSKRPVIETTSGYLSIGGETIRWHEIRSVDITGLHSPLVLRMTLDDGRKLRLVHPGDVRSSQRLLQRIRRNSREARIDGVPYSEFWGESAPMQAEAQDPGAARYRLVREEDEQEIEEIYRRLQDRSRADERLES